MESEALMGSMIGAIVFLVGAIVYLVRQIYFGNKNVKNYDKSDTKITKNGNYATTTMVDTKIEGCYQRINDHVGETNEHCRVQVASCNTLHMQFASKISEHDAHYEEILRILKRIENGREK